MKNLFEYVTRVIMSILLVMVMIMMMLIMTDIDIGDFDNCPFWKLMVAANFTLPDDMVFGQAQVIAITAYRC